MTFSYRDATAVIGPLAAHPQDGALDLCERHAQSATVPVGWQMLRLDAEITRKSEETEQARRDDGLTALAEALAAAETKAQERAEREERRRAAQQATAGMQNPWISRFEAPVLRPHLTVIQGGADFED